MTVATNVKKCLASLKSAQASLKQLSIETGHPHAKDTFKKASDTTLRIIDRIEQRLQTLEREEPQYKGY
ncbi:DUF1657 domain-containing protein [Thermoactinomyces mirandus]|uniref:DUF1657 domain-containing protein n=1 Tax=Thermoactinomyces mirandus TaxID=2756294 RepID=A0A7W1XSB0_9BACL|nr:DUF1657 domain-containing protein [Thermoactinomyces mirandus]MBA4602319.1 DUF1657 domain-containing protein [Thermoactinomyces mirandus]